MRSNPCIVSFLSVHRVSSLIQKGPEHHGGVFLGLVDPRLCPLQGPSHSRPAAGGWGGVPGGVPHGHVPGTVPARLRTQHYF